MNPHTSLSPFHLPEWALEVQGQQKTPLRSWHERMAFVIELSWSNVRHATGGPFGAAVFNMQTGQLISVGVNLVILSNCSLAHAEMVALANAEAEVKSFDFRAAGLPPYELVTSCAPCAMCFGAILSSGIRQVVCGARTEDAEAIGFDEGTKPDHWTAALENRGIGVQVDVNRDEAVAVLQDYRARGGVLYVPHRTQ
jgi:tRNA(Arg) A34 adenosine deaminase TadA